MAMGPLEDGQVWKDRKRGASSSQDHRSAESPESPCSSPHCRSLAGSSKYGQMFSVEQLRERNYVEQSRKLADMNVRVAKAKELESANLRLRRDVQLLEARLLEAERRQQVLQAELFERDRQRQTLEVQLQRTHASLTRYKEKDSQRDTKQSGEATSSSAVPGRKSMPSVPWPQLTSCLAVSGGDSTKQGDRVFSPTGLETVAEGSENGNASPEGESPTSDPPSARGVVGSWPQKEQAGTASSLPEELLRELGVALRKLSAASGGHDEDELDTGRALGMQSGARNPEIAEDRDPLEVSACVVQQKCAAAWRIPAVQNLTLSVERTDEECLLLLNPGQRRIRMVLGDGGAPLCVYRDGALVPLELVLLTLGLHAEASRWRRTRRGHVTFADSPKRTTATGRSPRRQPDPVSRGSADVLESSKSCVAEKLATIADPGLLVAPHASPASPSREARVDGDVHNAAVHQVLASVELKGCADLDEDNRVEDIGILTPVVEGSGVNIDVELKQAVESDVYAQLTSGLRHSLHDLGAGRQLATSSTIVHSAANGLEEVGGSQFTFLEAKGRSKASGSSSKSESLTSSTRGSSLEATMRNSQAATTLSDALSGSLEPLDEWARDGQEAVEAMEVEGFNEELDSARMSPAIDSGPSSVQVTGAFAADSTDGSARWASPSPGTGQSSRCSDGTTYLLTSNGPKVVEVGEALGSGRAQKVPPAMISEPADSGISPAVTPPQRLSDGSLEPAARVPRRSEVESSPTLVRGVPSDGAATPTLQGPALVVRLSPRTIARGPLAPRSPGTSRSPSPREEGFPGQVTLVRRYSMDHLHSEVGARCGSCSMPAVGSYSAPMPVPVTVTRSSLGGSSPFVPPPVQSASASMVSVMSAPSLTPPAPVTVTHCAGASPTASPRLRTSVAGSVTPPVAATSPLHTKVQVSVREPTAQWRTWAPVWRNSVSQSTA
mmetsp:Transcript_10366/g.18557  ORF Transcript_10366/g.18557 Transcript_10366/m.18557 type:complete len:952 (-) Transcript_10366:61-2916(-)